MTYRLSINKQLACSCKGIQFFVNKYERLKLLDWTKIGSKVSCCNCHYIVKIVKHKDGIEFKQTEEKA